MQHVSEVAPPIPNNVIEIYRKHFADSKVAKPIIANDLEEIVVFREEHVPAIVVTPDNVVRTEPIPVVLTSNVQWPSANRS
jgi:hypothetical protein